MYRLTDEPIDQQELLSAVADPAVGAVVTFIGLTRNHNDGRKVVSLSYEAYIGMAEKEMAKLGEEARRLWKVSKIAMIHRLGEVAIGEASVSIAVSAAHRAEAFEACQYLIDELKKRVPIWKKETFVGGEVWIGSQSGTPLSELKAP